MLFFLLFQDNFSRNFNDNKFLHLLLYLYDDLGGNFDDFELFLFGDYVILAFFLDVNFSWNFHNMEAFLNLLLFLFLQINFSRNLKYPDLFLLLFDFDFHFDVYFSRNLHYSVFQVFECLDLLRRVLRGHGFWQDLDVLKCSYLPGT